jgi:hypothetical protein
MRKVVVQNVENMVHVSNSSMAMPMFEAATKTNERPFHGLAKVQGLAAYSRLSGRGGFLPQTRRCHSRLSGST